MTISATRKPDPHPGVAALAIAGMALVVAAGLQLLGPIHALDDLILRELEALGLEGGFRELPGVWLWGWTSVMTLGLSQAILHVVGGWRRWLLACLGFLVTVTWIPVLALAAYQVPFGPPLIAWAWAVAGSMFYAARHSEPK